MQDKVFKLNLMLKYVKSS